MNESEIQHRLIAIEDELKVINQRNRRVESDKAWETSLLRRATICFLTYMTTASVFGF